MRQRAGTGWVGKIRFLRGRPVLAIGLSALSLLLVAGAIFLATSPLRGPHSGSLSAARGSGAPTPSNGNAGLGVSPIGNPASGAIPPNGNPASGAFPPSGDSASPSGPYPPYYAPASNGSPVTTFTIDCRLPVYAGQSGSGGFIVFPGGTFVADPRSAVTLPSPSPGATPTPQPGPGYGSYFPGMTYDHQYSRWLPVPTTWVSPDGGHYAYTGSDGIYIVNVANGTQTEMGEGHGWAIVGVQNAGVYASTPGGAGLSLFPFSGASRVITTTGYWQAVSSTAAYGTTTSAVPQGATNAIVRLDLNTGAVTDWFTREGKQSSVMGVDGQGSAIISLNFLNGSGTEIWIAKGPTNASAIAGRAYFGFQPNGSPVVDSHGIWFSGYSAGYNQSTQGVALYVAGSGFYWMSGIGGQLAGACS